MKYTQLKKTLSILLIIAVQGASAAPTAYATSMAVSASLAPTQEQKQTNTMSLADSPAPTQTSAFSKLLDLDEGNLPAVPIPAVVHKLSKNVFSINEDVSVTIDNVSGKDISAEVFDKDGNKVAVAIEESISGNTETISVEPPAQFKPGKYTLQVTDGNGGKIKQDFTWGVLAINTNKSVYSPNDTAKLAIAVLNENGYMVCDAKVTLVVTDPTGMKTTKSTTDNSIIVNKDQCSINQYTQKPDYESTYTVGGVGTYTMDLTAETTNGTYSIQDAFAVHESAPFDVERVSATRIFPALDYSVLFNITAHQDFEGIITETVPESFTVSAYSGTLTNAPEMEVDGKVLSASDSAVQKQASESAEQALVSEPAPTEIPKPLMIPFIGNYPISQGFSESATEPSLKALYERFNLAGHDGIDFAVPTGTQIIATDDGKVVLAGDGDYGITVVIEHPWGRSYYGHLSTTLVTEGQQVRKGELLGLSGNTGESTGPHLHFGIKPSQHQQQNGYYGKVDPQPYLGLSIEEAILGASTFVKTSREVTWKVSVKKGETFNLGYNYKAPSESPQFYTLGPLQFRVSPNSPTTQNALPSNLVFEEARLWQIAVDPEVTIDSAVVLNSGGRYVLSGTNIVFIDNDTGYVFYSDNAGDCVYKKTTNAGASWGSPVTVTVTAGTNCVYASVWYDRWTPGDKIGNYIHFAALEATTDEILYNRLDTTTDTLLSASSIDVSGTSTNTVGISEMVSITKATDGDLYIGGADATGGFVLKCTASCATPANWTSAGTNPYPAADNIAMLLPLKDGDIMTIEMDKAGDDIESKVYDESANTWDAGWTVIDGNAIEPAGNPYRSAINAVVDKTTWDIYVAYIADGSTIDADDDLRTAVYSNGSWTNTGDVFTNDSTGGLTGVSIGYDEMRPGHVYIAYSRRSTVASVSSGNVYYKSSTDRMLTWSAESSALAASNSDYGAVHVNAMSRERMYVNWYNGGTDPDELTGNTMVDLDPLGYADEHMRHGKWFYNGSVKPFEF